MCHAAWVARAGDAIKPLLDPASDAVGDPSANQIQRASMPSSAWSKTNIEDSGYLAGCDPESPWSMPAIESRIFVSDWTLHRR